MATNAYSGHVLPMAGSVSLFRRRVRPDDERTNAWIGGLHRSRFVAAEESTEQLRASGTARPYKRRHLARRTSTHAGAYERG